MESNEITMTRSGRMCRAFPLKDFHVGPKRRKPPIYKNFDKKKLDNNENVPINASSDESDCQTSFIAKKRKIDLSIEIESFMTKELLNHNANKESSLAVMELSQRNVDVSEDVIVPSQLSELAVPVNDVDRVESATTEKFDASFLKPTENEVKIPNIGDILWGRLAKYPYWPCILKNIRNEPNKKLEVAFFANNGRFALLKPTDVMPYKGKQNFFILKDEMLQNQPIKHSDVRAFCIKKSQQQVWLKAVDEADQCCPKENRLEFFEQLVAMQRASYNLKLKEKRDTSRRSAGPEYQKVLESYDTNKYERTGNTSLIHRRLSTDNPRRLSLRPAKEKRSVFSLSKSPAESTIAEISLQGEVIRKLETETFDITNFFPFGENPKILFSGLGLSGACYKCSPNQQDNESEAIVRQCGGWCGDFFHENCLLAVDGNNLCETCAREKQSFCFSCKKVASSELGNVDKCKKCHRCYHLACVKQYNQTCINKSEIICPMHLCQTCTWGKTHNVITTIQVQNDHQLVKCIKCPNTYHNLLRCVPAGSELLSRTEMVCPKHSHDKSTPTNWCFICTKSGKLLCCEYCPTACHLKCLKLDVEPDKYICETCKNGRMPLYGELVWAKLSRYRFWPAIVVPPHLIPKPVLRKKKGPFNVCVCFFGQHNYSWVAQCRTYSYIKGDSNANGSNKSFNRSLVEAREVFKQYTELKSKEESPKMLHKPQNYKSILTNKYLLNTTRRSLLDIVDKCKCTEDDPCATSNCHNRMIKTECHSCMPNCQNKMFSNRQWRPVYTRYNEGKGFGLFSKEYIKSGSFVIEYVGEVIEISEANRRAKVLLETRDDKYYMLGCGSSVIDAGPSGNAARFINHSCDPNCEVEKWNVEGFVRIGIFAITDIQPDQELTFHYNLEAFPTAVQQTCLCGSKKCCGFIGKQRK